MKRALPLLLVLFLTSTLVADDVPVKQVVLFSSGVGYFEHSGTVKDNASTELRFKTEQINDILKSLVLEDMDGGSVSTITYPSQDPIAKTLKSFQVDITNNPPLADLLNQLRGAKITVQSQAEKISGTILGVETKRKPVEKGEPVQVSVLNLLTGANIRAIELDTVTDLQLDDAGLQEELNKALQALAQSRDQDKKPVVINFTGKGERHVRIGYVVETPVWKTSYRLIMDDKNSKLQGWAIVENQTDSDWNGVNLSLVSGRPISFIENLYQPLYIPRPVVEPRLYASLRPQNYEEGMRGEVIAGKAMQKASREMNMQAPMAVAAMPSTPPGATEQPMDIAASVQSVASAQQMGELFQYTVNDVTLARQKSAMLPIITDPVEVEKLSIYNASVLPRNPLNGARLKNTTSKHLLQGPITVFAGNGYAGDAQIDNLPPGQERFLSYGIDLDMLVDNTKNSEDSSILTGKIVKGVLQISRKNIASIDYAAENKSDNDKTLIIEHPLREGWNLVDTDKPIESTPTLYRFKVSVPAHKSDTLTVKEQIVQGEEIAILSADIDALVTFTQNGAIPQKVKDALVKAMQMRQALTELETQMAETDQKLKDSATEQARVRENLKTLSSQQQGQPYQRQLNKLNDIETQIETLHTQHDDLQKKRDAQKAELEEYLNGLSVE